MEAPSSLPCASSLLCEGGTTATPPPLPLFCCRSTSPAAMSALGRLACGTWSSLLHLFEINVWYLCKYSGVYMLWQHLHMHVHFSSGTRHFLNSWYRRCSCALCRCAGQCQQCVRSSALEYKRLHSGERALLHSSVAVDSSLAPHLAEEVKTHARHTQDTRKTHAFCLCRACHTPLP